MVHTRLESFVSGAYLNPEQFKRDLLPTVLKLFGSSDRKSRVRLNQIVFSRDTDLLAVYVHS